MERWLAGSAKLEELSPGAMRIEIGAGVKNAVSWSSWGRKIDKLHETHLFDGRRRHVGRRTSTEDEREEILEAEVGASLLLLDALLTGLEKRLLALIEENEASQRAVERVRP